MHSRTFKFFQVLFASSCLLWASSLPANYESSKKTVVDLSVQEHYSQGQKAYQDENWEELLRHFTIIQKKYKTSSLANDALYYEALGLFNLGDPEAANNRLDQYLSVISSPKFFEETAELKFQIAEAYRKGSRRHLFGLESMPKWVRSKSDSLEIYEELMRTFPYHEITARALSAAAKVYLKQKNYRQSIESLNKLIQRFPKHHLVPDAYVELANVYLKQCKKELDNPDLLSLAEINRRKFLEQFPQHDFIAKLDIAYKEMEQVYAQALYETGRFYERRKKTNSSLIYYKNAIARFPETKAAESSQKRLVVLDPEFMISDLNV